MFGRFLNRQPKLRQAPPPQGDMYELWIKVGKVHVKSASFDHRSAVQLMNLHGGKWVAQPDYSGVLVGVYTFTESFDYIRVQTDGYGFETMRLELSIPEGSYLYIP
ncbi:hypothetical protein [Xanthomonas phage BUDD]|nr:hypothetical protein [Xanthomonas phage BUDD]